MELRYFTSSEFDSPDVPGSGAGMQRAFLLWVDYLRHLWGKPIRVSKGGGFRTPEHNVAVGGKPDSAHLRGWAGDLDTTTLEEAIRLVCLARDQGCRRTGVSLTGRFVHVDLDPKRPRAAVWFYP